MLLGADIGGTKTNMAYFEVQNKQPTCKIYEKYINAQYSSFEEILLDFTKKHSLKVQKACLAVAGPVYSQAVKTTNLPWQIQPSSISKMLGNAKVHIINDVEANAWGIQTLKDEDYITLHQPSDPVSGNKALISAGTGLGQAALYFDGQIHHPFATEAGHADFAPRNKKEAALLEYLSHSLNHVSYEHVLSGPGLYRLYQFLNQYTNASPAKEFKEQLQQEDPAAVISNFSDQDPICRQTLEMFTAFYGAEAGNMALRYLALGGVYLGGGIAPKILSWLQKPLFLEAFMKKGRFQHLLETVPIYVILNDQAALYGAGHCAFLL